MKSPITIVTEISATGHFVARLATDRKQKARSKASAHEAAQILACRVFVGKHRRVLASGMPGLSVEPAGLRRYVATFEGKDSK